MLLLKYLDKKTRNVLKNGWWLRTQDISRSILAVTGRCGSDHGWSCLTGWHQGPSKRQILEYIFSVIQVLTNKPWFLRVCSISLLKTLWEKEKLLVTSNFSFSLSVFYSLGELSAVFTKYEIVVCKVFEFGTVYNLLFGKGLRMTGDYEPRIFRDQFWLWPVVVEGTVDEVVCLVDTKVLPNYQMLNYIFSVIQV